VTALRDALTAVLGAPVTNLVRVAGGASRETWAFDAGGDALVLRRDPLHDPQPEGMAREAAAFVAAAAAGVPVPRLRAHGDGSDGIGSPYVVTAHVDGETIPRRLLRDERWAGVRAGLAGELGGVLARIHAIPVGSVPGLAIGDRLAGLRADHERFGEPRPALELVLRRLAEQQPPAVTPRVVHGDFRNGNLIIGEDGVRAVLDWELVHAGDPLEDLGWLCARAWRFGAPLPVGGFGTREQLLDGYAAVAGWRPDPEVLRWWETFAAASWAVICRRQAERHLGGAEQSVEMAVLGRRIAESEHDALVSLGLTGPVTVTDPLTLPATADASLHDRPTVDELLAAVAGFLTGELGEIDDPRLRFSARVAANALKIARRELRVGDAQRADHRSRLAALGCADDAELVAAIRTGSFDDRADQVLAVVREATVAKLTVADPRHLS